MDNRLKKIYNTIELVKKNQNVNVFNWNETLKNKTVVAFGLGKFFKDTHERLYKMCDVKYLCDNNKDYWGSTLYNRRCISPDELKNIPNVFVIAVVGNYNPIRVQLDEMGIESMHITEMHFEYYLKGNDISWIENALPKIEKVYNLLQDEKSKELYSEIICKKLGAQYSDLSYEQMATSGEYFEQGIWELNDKECFLDVGAYVGDTIRDFLHSVNNKFNKIYSLELSPTNALKLQNYVNSIPESISSKIEVICAGAWDKNDEYWCDAYGDMIGCAVMQTERGERCKLVKLDDIVPVDEVVTTLKMDVEGAELKAIEGANRIISINKPKLAICIYHRAEDFWEVPLKIIQLCPEYKLYIRHHDYCNFVDTILYAYI